MRAAAILRQLERFADAFGDDLPLRVPAREPVRAEVRPPARPEPTAQSQPALAPSPASTTQPPPDPEAVLAELREEVLPCTRCKLHASRKNVVFGEGSPTARVMFVGEAPGAVEDRTGRPFVGPAGQLLDRIIENAMGLRRQDVFIANINKCRPPGNREPEPDEVAACLPYLRRQVQAIRPAVIVALGRVAAHNLLGITAPMRTLRGRELKYEQIPVVATWHPAYLLRNPAAKRDTWEDIKRVNRLLGRPEVPGPPE